MQFCRYFSPHTLIQIFDTDRQLFAQPLATYKVHQLLIVPSTSNAQCDNCDKFCENYFKGNRYKNVTLNFNMPHKYFRTK